MADTELTARVDVEGEAEAIRALRSIQAQMGHVHTALGQLAAAGPATASGMHQMTGGLESASRAASSASSGFHLNAVAMGAVAGAAQAVTTALIGLAQQGFAAVAQSAIGFNAHLEQAQIGFTTLLKSGEAAETFLKDLRDFAQRTPFEFKELIPAAQRLKAMGFEAADIIPILTDVGNVASSMGGNMKESVDRVVRALGQMRSAGRVNAEDMNQLIDVGVPAWQILADAIGKTTGEARKMSEEGKLSSDIMINAFRQWSQANIGDAMEKQSKTFIGAMSSIRDAVESATAQAFQPLFETIRDLAVRLSGFLQSTAFEAWAQRIGAAFAPLGPLLNTVVTEGISRTTAVFDTLGTVGARLGPTLERLAFPLAAIGQGLQTLGDLLLGGALTALDAASLQLAGFGETLDSIGATLGPVAERLGTNLQTVAEAIGGAFSVAGAILADFWSIVSQGSAAPDVLGMLAQGANLVLDALEALGSVAGPVLGTLERQAIQMWTEVRPLLVDLAAFLGETLPPILGALGELWGEFWAHAGPLVQAAWGMIAPVLQMMTISLGETLIGTIRAFREAWAQVWEGVARIMAANARVLAQIAPQIGQAFGDAVDSITAALNDMSVEARTASMETAHALTTGFVRELPRVENLLEGFRARAVGTFTATGASATTGASGVQQMTTAVTGLGTASEKTQSALDIMNKLMKEMGQSTIPANVIASLQWDNTLRGLQPLFGQLDLVTSAHARALLNAGDATGALNLAGKALGLTQQELHQITMGNITATDALAEAAWRHTAALRAEQEAAAALAQTMSRAGITMAQAAGATQAVAALAGGGTSPIGPTMGPLAPPALREMPRAFTGGGGSFVDPGLNLIGSMADMAAEAEKLHEASAGVTDQTREMGDQAVRSLDGMTSAWHRVTDAVRDNAATNAQAFEQLLGFSRQISDAYGALYQTPAGQSGFGAQMIGSVNVGLYQGASGMFTLAQSNAFARIGDLQTAQLRSAAQASQAMSARGQAAMDEWLNSLRQVDNEINAQRRANQPDQVTAFDRINRVGGARSNWEGLRSVSNSGNITINGDILGADVGWVDAVHDALEDAWAFK